MIVSVRNTVFALVGLVLTAAGAMAQSAPPPGERWGPKPISAADMAKHHAEMCTERYAHTAGRLTSLEIELTLSDKQKSAFEKWKAVKLAAAKADADHCRTQSLPPPPPKDGAKPTPPSPNEAFKQEIRHLQDRLAGLKAEEPAFEALLATLSEEQLSVFAPHHGGPDGGPHGGPDNGYEAGRGAELLPPPPHD